MPEGKNECYTRQKTIGEVQYTAQYSGLSLAARLMDECYLPNGTQYSFEKAANFILKNAIVDPPGLSLADFDDMDTLCAVMEFGGDVLRGKFLHAKNEGRA